MSNPFLVIFGFIVAIIAAYIAMKLVVGIILTILHMVIPVLILGGIVYVLYQAFGAKALGGGRRTLP